MSRSTVAARLSFVSILLLMGLGSCMKEKPAYLLEEMDSTHTGVSFVNKVGPIHGKLSIVDYLYYYNGGGVAAGDINNDGLTDLFFVSNTDSNKLYLNKGNFQFQDISAKAGIEGFSEWKTGVTMADVNGDGLLDIYVCAVADYLGLEGSNELYINNGDLTFTERAADFDLDFSGFSTQSLFFDYDHDGDLDMYLLNHSVHTSRSYDKVIARLLPDKSAGDYLYRNDDGKYVDVSQAAGIYQAAMGYGLGVAVADLNNDGWEDIYVANDFHEDDYYYVNNKNGTFTEAGRKSFGHFSRFSMGCDIADVNNDGFQDIMTMDMHPESEVIEKSSIGEDPWDLYLYKLSYGYHYQFSRNCLQVNNAGKKFTDCGIMAGVSSTDWSWSTLLADINNDGYKDIFVTNGIVKRPTDLDYLKFSHEDSMLYAAELTKGQIELAIQRMPEGKVHNYVFEGSKDLIFRDRSDDWGLVVPNISNGAAYADLDNDGDLDLVTNNLNEPASILRNRASESIKNNYVSFTLKGGQKNAFGIGARVYVKTSAGFQMQQMVPTRGFLSSVEPRLSFGLGKATRVDTVVVAWNNGRSQTLVNVEINRQHVLDQSQATESDATMQLFAPGRPMFEDITADVAIDYIHKENKHIDFYREALMPFMVSNEGPPIAVGDVNGDGAQDFYVGGAKHQSGSLFLQKKGGFVRSIQKAFQVDSVYEDVNALFFDADNDGDLDLYVVTGGNEFYGRMPQQFDRLYFNDGRGNFVRNLNALPPMYENKGCVKASDFDKDGDLDLFVGGRVTAYKYGKIPRSYLLVNDGRGVFTDGTDNHGRELAYAGMISDAAWLDIDSDGDDDLVLAGDWMPLKLFRNEDGRLKEQANPVDERSMIKRMNGFWQCIATGDFDGDGDLDVVAGNLGTNTKLMRNGNESILKMYVKDFDHNGQAEQIVTYQRADGKFYTTASKDELGKQLPSIVNKKFRNYKAFAGRSVDEILPRPSLDSAAQLEVNQFQSVYLENTGNGSFIVTALPAAAQTSKIFAILPGDFDHDGQLDFIAGGNFFGGSAFQSTYDASLGVLMKGDGKGNFTPVSNGRSGLWIDGQARDMKSIQWRDQIIYLISKNNARIQIIKND